MSDAQDEFGAILKRAASGERLAAAEAASAFAAMMSGGVSEMRMAAFLTVPDIIMRAMFARGAFSKADAVAAGATLAAYAIGLIPFVTIRSAVATFYARKDTATPMKAAPTRPPMT